MKRYVIIILFAFMVFVLLSCGPSAPEPTQDEVRELLNNISSSPFGMTIGVESEAIEIAPASKKEHGHKITLKNPAVKVSSEIYKKLAIPVPDFEFPLKIETLVLLYNPERDFLGIDSVGGLDMTIDADFLSQLQALQHPETEESSEPPMELMRFAADAIQYHAFDISAMLNSRDGEVLDILGKMVAANPQAEVLFEGGEIEIKGTSDVEHLKLAVQTLEMSSSGASELIKAFFQPEGAGETLKAIIEKGDPIFEVGYGVQGLDINLEVKELSIQAGMESFSVDYSARPNAARDAVDFAYAVKLGRLFTQGLPEKKWQIVTALKNLEYEFALEGLPADFIVGYFEIIHSAQKAAGDPEAAQGLGMQGMAMLGQLLQAKPAVALRKFSLEHELGSVEANAEFRFVRMGPPVGKGTLKVSAVDKIAERLVESGLITQDMADEMLQSAKGFLKIAADGTGSLELEIREDDLQNIYINGNPLPMK